MDLSLPQVYFSYRLVKKMTQKNVVVRNLTIVRPRKLVVNTNTMTEKELVSHLLVHVLPQEMAVKLVG